MKYSILGIFIFAAWFLSHNVEAYAAERKPTRTPAIADFNTCALPQWPKASLRNEEQGTTTLSFLIGPTGSVDEARVGVSSGFEGLDNAALDAIRQCSFKPGTVSGRPIQAWLSMQYVWSIGSDESEPASSKDAPAETARAPVSRTSANNVGAHRTPKGLQASGDVHVEGAQRNSVGTSSPLDLRTILQKSPYLKHYKAPLTTPSGHLVYGTSRGLACLGQLSNPDSSTEAFRLTCAVSWTGCFLETRWNGKCGTNVYPLSGWQAPDQASTLMPFPKDGKGTIFVSGYNECMGGGGYVLPFRDGWVALCGIPVAEYGVLINTPLQAQLSANWKSHWGVTW